jgi:adenylate cyclase
MVPSNAMRPIAIAATTELGAPPEDVWRFVADTDRTNRVLGARPVAYTPIEEDGPASTRSARYLAKTSAGAFDLTYEEAPFEWSHGRELRVVRKMRGGLIAAYTLTWSLAPSDKAVGGTRVTVKLELWPRYAIVRPAVWVEGRSTIGKLVTFLQSIDAHVRDRAPSPFAKPVGRVDETLLGQGVAALEREGVSPLLARRLAEVIRGASDADLVRIRPFELADTMKESRDEVLTAMLRGVPAGLFDLKWAIVCPSCRTASEMTASLAEVKPEGHCQLCDISFELELDRAVEATFVPHEAVRQVEAQMFCISGPARTPHVWAQTNLAADETRPLPAPTTLGRYRVFARGGAVASVEVEAGAPAHAEATIDSKGESAGVLVGRRPIDSKGESAGVLRARRPIDGAAIRPPEIHVAPGGSLLVRNATAEPRHVKVERLGYASDAATAHHLSTVGDFRRLFSRDLLKRGTPLKVARVAILFSDLTGSTALYAKLGDAAAFRLVDDHFDVLRAAIARHDGVVVKTMGDAVMAAFRDPRACMRAATESLRGFARFCEASEHGGLVGLKVGAVAGPCYVVTANGALDYFGQTVNVASRVQHLAGTGEVVVPFDFFAGLGEEERASLVLKERFEARVKGVDAPLDLVRLALIAIEATTGARPGKPSPEQPAV